MAEACSNLAILYNQNGDYARAKPLYERALRIWEKVKGPDCADVAHTLTGGPYKSLAACPRILQQLVKARSRSGASLLAR